MNFGFWDFREPGAPLIGHWKKLVGALVHWKKLVGAARPPITLVNSLVKLGPPELTLVKPRAAPDYTSEFRAAPDYTSEFTSETGSGGVWLS